MTAEYVAVDEPRDQDEQPSRPVGAQLAVLGERAVDLPVDVLVMVGRELSAVRLGALLLYSKVRLWQADAAQRGRLDDAAAVAKAAGGKLPLAHEEASIKRREKRARIVAAVIAVAAAGLTAASIVSITWGGWQTAGVVGAVLLLWLAKEYKLRVWALLAPAPVAVTVLLGVERWRWWPAAVVLVGALLVCEQVGMRWRPPGVSGADKHVHAGVSFPKLWETIRLALLADGVVVTSSGARPIVAEGQEIGAVYRVASEQQLERKHLDALERLLDGVPVGGVRWFPDRGQAGAGELHVRWADILDRPGVVPPPEPRGSGSVHDATRIGRGQLGVPLRLCRLRKHIVVLGGTGSGKTSLGWRLLDDVVENADEKPWGIDLRRKNLIAPYVRSFEGRVAYSPADADKLLDRFQAEIDRRVARIAEKLEDADEDDIPDENWIPTAEPGHEQLTLFVDELTSLTPHKTLREKLALIEETGRQAACVVVLLTPDLDSKKIGDSSIFDQPHVKIVMATSQYDIKEMFGPGASAAGWGLPATWERPRDAGKLLIASDEHLHPEVYRADRLEMSDVVARRKRRRVDAERIAAERAAAASSADEPEVIDAEIVTDEELAREAALRAAIGACGGREGLPVSEVMGALGEDVAATLRVAVAARSVWVASEGKSVRCFPRSALVSALRDT